MSRLLTVFAAMIGLGLLAAIAAPPARAQGRWINVGQGRVERIHSETDPMTWEEVPPFAFGDYAFTPENVIFLEIIPRPCEALPDRSLCQDGTFVAAARADLNPGTCPCTGVLLKEIEVRLHYDPAAVQALGARESDLRLVLYESSMGVWNDIPGGFEVDPQADVVRGWQASHVSQTYAVITGPPQESMTWGEIKAQWR